MYYVRDNVFTYWEFTARSNHYYKMYHIGQDKRVNKHATHAVQGSTGIFFLQSDASSNEPIVSKLESVTNLEYSIDIQLDYVYITDDTTSDGAGPPPAGG